MNIKIQAIDTFSDKKLQELSSFLSKVFPKTDKFSSEFVKWQYRECPDGAMIGFNAYDGDRLVSHFAALPLKMSFYKKIYKGAVAINVSTDPAYQGKKLFTKLGQATVDYAKNNGFDFLGVDFSNFFFKLPKWVKISPFNLVFKDLTGGKISHIKKEDFFYTIN